MADNVYVCVWIPFLVVFNLLPTKTIKQNPVM